MSVSGSDPAASDEGMKTWEFGEFDQPAAAPMGQLPEVSDGDGCVCTSAAGAGGAFRQ